MLVSKLESGRQLNVVVALRALAALAIVWHHFASYPPLQTWAAPLLGSLLEWFEAHARATQVFFVVGGFVMARSMAEHAWDIRKAILFLSRRYLRLGLPYLAVILLAIPIYSFARGWVPDEVLGGAVTLRQFLAHLFFLQDILGYEALSAGLWFVCINIQLYLLFALLLWLRDGPGRGRVAVPVGAGWGLAAFSLFYANLAPGWDVWAVYFFPYFFMGVVVWRASGKGSRQWEFWLYQAMFALAMYFEWRWRLAASMVVGWLLLVSLQKGYAAVWPASRLILWLGRISYSLFLVHFPVLVVVAALWSRQGWTSAPMGVAGLLTAFALSVVVAGFFHRWVESPSASASRKISWLGEMRRVRTAVATN
jgi:peptidoglycan/LPS O-acetylase OafA/YrhL